MVVLFCLDVWEIFFLATPGFELGPLDLWSCTLPLCHSDFCYSTLTISGIELCCRGIGGGIVLIGSVRDFLFGHIRVWTRDLWISSHALYPLSTLTTSFHLWQFQVFNSVAEGLVVVLFRLDLWVIFFLATPGFEPGTSGDLVLHSTTVPQRLLVFTSNNFSYLILVHREWWRYFSGWTCERFSFWPHKGLNQGTSGSLVLHSTTAPWHLLVFTFINFRH